MIIDIILIALLIAHPTYQLLIWIVVLFILRHTPLLADEIARRLDLDSYHGLTAIVARLALPAWEGARVMSPLTPLEEDSEGAVSMPTTVLTAETVPIAAPNNEYNGNLSDSARIQFEERAHTIADLYETGMVTNLSKAICRVYACSVQASSKTDSTYQLALKAVNRHLTKNKPQFRQPDSTTAPATHPVSQR